MVQGRSRGERTEIARESEVGSSFDSQHANWEQELI